MQLISSLAASPAIQPEGEVIMSSALKTGKFAALGLCALALFLGTLNLNASTAARHKTKKPLVPLHSGPTGPVPQVPLDSIRPVAPQVNFQNGQLTIVAPNSSLGDILRAIHQQTGAEIEIPPDAHERVVTRLGPGPARDVVADLLNGSRFNYVLVGSPEDSNALTRVVLVAKAGPDVVPAPAQPSIAEAAGNNMAPPPQANAQPDASDADATDDANAQPDENAEQPAAEAEQEQPAAQADQPGVKTPQQMLQEMQQRQMQLQQMQPAGQPPVPGSGMQPHPPQEQ